MEHKAIVFIERSGEPIPVGRLIITEDGRYSRSDFDYGRKYLERPDAVAVDPVQMPLGPKHLRSDDDFTLFNGLRDASPDAWGRKMIDLYMRRNLGRTASEAEYLLVSQRGTRIGALQFGPTTAGPAPVLEVGLPDVSSDLGSLESFQEMVDLFQAGNAVPDSLLDHVAPGSDLGGARPKGTVTIEGHPWLAKFGMESDKVSMAAAEAGCLDLCEMAGIDVCDRDIIDVAGRQTLLLKRFDRERLEDGRLGRRHMISGLTLLGAHEMDRGMSGYADLYNGLRRYGTGNDAGEVIFRRMVMNVLVGNEDDHYRNHAFLCNEKGLYEPSPVYDVTPTTSFSHSRKLFLHLGKAGSGRDAILENAVAAGPSFGLRSDHAAEIAEDLSAMVAANWRRVLSDRGASKNDLQALENSFSAAGTRVKAENPFETPGTDEEASHQPN
ncbi:type II toxin-antitoxin system HipA family toxin [Pseudosulfitobacter pseudonitzschiae]|uniref:type II toxin-antitoxin system HipA family toxin n=1 Tax=Pseudosulfitobacter pseudonitzschiae TaxID=1402135 RepID=UPI003B7D3A01